MFGILGVHLGDATYSRVPTGSLANWFGKRSFAVWNIAPLPLV